MQFSPRAVSASSLAADNDSPSPKSPIKSIEARPNNNLALNDTYIEQSDPVEVLKDWKVRLTANPSTTTSTYHWEKKEDKDSDWSSIGDGQTVEWDVGTMGDYHVRLNSDPSVTRHVIVTEVTLVSFSLKVGSPYKLPTVHTPPNFSQDNHRPYDPAQTGDDPTITITGHVKAIQGAPATKKIGQGPIQGLEGSSYREAGCIQIHWFDPPISKPGDKVTVPTTWNGANYPDIPLVNDAPKDRYLMGGMKAADIDKEAKATDSPKLYYVADDDIQQNLKDPDNPEHTPAAGWFALKNNPAAFIKTTFTDWWVVGNKITNQWVPMKQQQWKLELNNTVQGEQAASIVGSAANPSSKPTDGSQTTVDDYRKDNIAEKDETVTKP